jgi:8-oxo-dGTP pyrophosphatase MutT (NUDIX family)
MSSSGAVSIRPAATLLLLRDLPQFQVLMVRRHHQIEFAGGALVFPGGKVEAHDRPGDPAGLDPQDAAARMAAVRETFEESGVLLAIDDAGQPCAPGPALEEARAQVTAGAPLAEVLAERGLSVNLAALTPFARWIAPEGVPKRYDTRFYLASAPADQLAACDGHETVDAEWIAPVEALALAARGARSIVFPTRMNLRRLGESGAVEEALAAARARPLTTVQPVLEMRSGAGFVVLSEAFGYGAVEEPFASV